MIDHSMPMSDGAKNEQRRHAVCGAACLCGHRHCRNPWPKHHASHQGRCAETFLTLSDAERAFLSKESP